jgi:hypothetical protein
MVFAIPEQPDWMFGIDVTDDGRYLVITVSQSCENSNHFYYVDLQNQQFDSQTGNSHNKKNYRNLIKNFFRQLFC